MEIITNIQKEKIIEAVEMYLANSKHLMDQDGDIQHMGHYISYEEYIRATCNDKGPGSMYCEYLGDLIKELEDDEQIDAIIEAADAEITRQSGITI